MGALKRPASGYDTSISHPASGTAHMARSMRSAAALIRKLSDLMRLRTNGAGFPARSAVPGPGFLAPERDTISLLPYIASIVFVVAALLVGLVLQRFLQVTNVSLVFLVAVLTSALTGGLGPSLFASLLSVLAFNFFFLPPLYTFTIAEAENIVALIVFAVVAMLTSELAARVRRQAVVARRQQNTTAALYAFSRKLAGIGNLDDLLWATAYQIASMLRVRVVLLLSDGKDIRVRVGYPPEDQLSELDLAAAHHAWQNRRPAGRGTDALPLFVPLLTDRNAIGVVGVRCEGSGRTLDLDERSLLDALADQAAIAIERINLATAIEEARVDAETERLRAALLISISHDLRTPLASILGAATSLRSYGRAYDDAAREDLLATLHEEAERLNRYVGNLLDMTRLESGAVALKRSPVDLQEVIETALRRTGPVLERHRVEVQVAPNLPILDLDYLLLEQVLVNLLDNAAKYTQAGTLVRITARREEDLVAIDIADEGPGIPAGDLDRIFDKFYRVHDEDRRRAGTGLGLAICRGFMHAMGGRLTVQNRQDRCGAVFTVTLPVEASFTHGMKPDE